MFELIQRDGLARIGKLTTKGGVLDTPALLPVVNPKILTVKPHELKETFGFDGLITNSYIIRNDDALRDRALSEGLHSLLGFDGVVMTDSGTFQSHMYGEVEVRNEDIVSFQRDIGSDIGTVLDIFTEPYWTKSQTEDAVMVTLDRTEEATGLRGDMLIAGVVQGSVFPDLREYCANGMRGMDVGVHPIGGVVPLMEQYRYPELVDVILASKKGLDPSRPVHLFGAGHPMILALATLLGCDMFDSASYAKFARDDRMMFVDGTRRLKEMGHLGCDCPACRDHDLESLRALPKEERVRVIAMHNLHEISHELERVRTAIREGRIWELAENRCRAHPSLLSGLRKLREHKDLLERYEPVSRPGSLFATGDESLHRPAFHRYERRLFTRYRPPTPRYMEMPEAGKPYSRVYWEALRDNPGADILVRSPIGPVPLELDEVYPIAQSMFPEADEMMDLWSADIMTRFLERYDIDLGGGAEGEPMDLDVERAKAVADYQFGLGASDALMDGEIALVKSRNTGKIRNVIVDGEHVLSMRAPDGLYTLRPEGARKLHARFHSPRLRVVVDEDSAEFNLQGRNVFCRFVLDCDPEIRPMEEVMVVDADDRLLAVGRALMVKDEMMCFKAGMAVKVRDGMGQ